MPLKLAAEAEGVAESTVHYWIERNQAFAGAVTRAKAVAAKTLTLHGLAGGKGSGTATWLLERRFREDYGPPAKDDGDKGTITVLVEGGLPRLP